MRFPISTRLSSGGQSTFAILHLSFGCIGDSEQHAGVSAAATEIASQPSAHLFDAGVRMLPNKSGRSHDETRRAKAALLGVVFHESFLHGVEFIRSADPFDGRDVVTL